ncbi:MAG: MupG family TIM beta-alpha barrel fold protein [Mycoplasmatales bacterium]
MIIGVSLYINSIDETYLKMLKESSVNSIFTSLHIPEEKFEQEKLKKILEFGKKNQLPLMVDISPFTMEKLQITDLKQLKNLGIKQIRLDFGFDDALLVKELCETFKVTLNPSTVTHAYIEELQKIGANFSNVEVLHNFYLKINSGLDEQMFIETNQYFKSQGVKVSAFVNGDQVLRYPTFEGLVTLEQHRGVDPYAAAVELVKKYRVDGVYIGDGMISAERFKYFTKLDQIDEVLYVRATLYDEYQELYNQPIEIRADSNSRMVRLLTRKDNKIVQKNVFQRQCGNIAITNEHYLRYNHEIEIALTDLGYDHRFNTIGQIDQRDLLIIHNLKGTKKIVFIKSE